MLLILVPVILLAGTLMEVILPLVILMLLVQDVVDFPEVVVEVVHLEVVEVGVDGVGKTGWQFTISSLVVFEQTKRR